MPKPEWAAVFDFDGTFTGKAIGSVVNLIDCALTESALRRSKRLRKHYLARAHAGLLSQEDEKKWLSGNIKSFVRSRLSKDKIRQILKGVKLRVGSRETLEFLKRHNVPVAIVSYGISDFIQVVLRANKVSHLVDKVYSAKLTYDAKGIVTGFKPRTEVFPSSKGEFSRLFARQCGVPPKRILAVGDSGSDFQLGYLKENRFGIAQNREERRKLGRGMGDVAVTEDFAPALGWFAKKIGTPDTGHKLIILVGPSAVGKTHWIKQLLKLRPADFFVVRSTTTRASRNDQDRRLYCFVTKEEFQRLKADQAFVESDFYLKNFYGSRWSTVRRVLKKNNGIFALTPRGAIVWYQYRFAVNVEIVILKPSSEKMLRRNLERRGITDKRKQKKYLRRAHLFKLPRNVRHHTLILTGKDLDGPKMFFLIDKLLRK